MVKYNASIIYRKIAKILERKNNRLKALEGYGGNG